MSSTDKPSKLEGGAAVGLYLRTLREAAGISVAEIADSLGTDTSAVWRIENWKSDTRSSALFKFIQLVNGDPGDVALLINNSKAKKEDGLTLARLRLGLQNK